MKEPRRSMLLWHNSLHSCLLGSWLRSQSCCCHSLPCHQISQDFLQEQDLVAERRRRMLLELKRWQKGQGQQEGDEDEDEDEQTFAVVGGAALAAGTGLEAGGWGGGDEEGEGEVPESEVGMYDEDLDENGELDLEGDEWSMEGEEQEGVGGQGAGTGGAQAPSGGRRGEGAAPGTAATSAAPITLGAGTRSEMEAGVRRVLVVSGLEPEAVAACAGPTLCRLLAACGVSAATLAQSGLAGAEAADAAAQGVGGASEQRADGASGAGARLGAGAARGAGVTSAWRELTVCAEVAAMLPALATAVEGLRDGWEGRRLPLLKSRASLLWRRAQREALRLAGDLAHWQVRFMPLELKV